jgi:hypothetical protein
MKDVHYLGSRCDEITQSAITKSKRKEKSIHRIERINLRSGAFFCEVLAEPAQSKCVIYKFINHENGFFCLAYDQEKEVIYHFKSHFFERYHERLELNIEEAERLLNHYLHQNGMFTIVHRHRENKRMVAMKGMFKTGVGYGAFDTKQQVYYFRTFISFNQMGIHKKIENNVDLTTKETVDLLSQKYKVVSR